MAEVLADHVAHAVELGGIDRADRAARGSAEEELAPRRPSEFLVPQAVADVEVAHEAPAPLPLHFFSM